MIFKVKILKVSNPFKSNDPDMPRLWYADKIGNWFLVKNNQGEEFIVAGGIYGSFSILKKDCEIMEQSE